MLAATVASPLTSRSGFAVAQSSGSGAQSVAVVTTSSVVLQPRQFAAVAHDSVDHQFLLFGGTYGYQVFDDTWSLGGSGWQRRTPLIHPGARISGAAAYDSYRAEYVLFGGRVKNTRPALCSPGTVPKELTTQVFCSDTWLFRNNLWSQKLPARSPSAREMHAMAFDAASRQVVLFGGVAAGSSAPLNDTWVWDGSTWTQVATAHTPPARFGHAMAYDPVHQQVVLFGGNAGTKILNDTWLWNGRDWLAAPAQTTPPATLTGAGLDYSSSLGKMVLFSGLAWDALRVASVSLDAWSWDGGQWKKLPVTTFELISDFTKLTAAEATKGILANGTPTVVWVPR